MPLKRGWLTEGLGNFMSAGMIGVVRQAGAAFNLEVPEDVSELTREDGEYGGFTVRALSETGGAVGSPLGLLPVLTILYAAGLGEIQGHDARRVYQPARIPPEILARLNHRGYISPEDLGNWQKDLHDQGWGNERVDALMESYRVLLTTGEIRELYLRGMFGEGEPAKVEAIGRIMQHGINEDDANNLFDIFFFIPPPQDLINWAAKEVFEPDAVEKYGLKEEFDKLDLTLFAKVGVSKDIAEKYWTAHWQHPGLNTIQELLHRTEFSIDDMWEWFRLVEIPPFWRDKLIQIAYTPFTRVDIRRMYREGILTEAEVNKAYHDIGYDDWHAGKLTAWTIKYYAPEDTGEDKEVRELTKSEILRGYEDRVIDRETALLGLQGIDYSPGIAEYLVILRDVKLAEAETKEALIYIGNAYKLGILNESDLIDRLGELDLAGEQQEYYIEKFKRGDIQKAILPSKADFKRWLKLKIITEPDFRSYLTKQGYIEEHIQYYVNEVDASKREELPSGN